MEEYQEQSNSFSSENGALSVAISIEDEGGEDEQFYEKIEAPKFVDFTAPDHYCPDDRYWFCLRVGCDQKHEEEMDSEAIYSNFVLRVMAARSPNVKLRRTLLNGNASRTPIKCPRSAPPKSSKSRLSSRLAVVSSIPQKMVNDKSKVVRPLLKPESTPRNKTKPVAARYLTTPRNKKCLPNSNSFRSVQNQKPTTIEISKSRSVAKTLVFHSPKKAVKVKTSMELRTPITKLREGMKRLEITSQKKHFLGYSSKSVKNLDNNYSCSRRLLKGSKVQRTAGEQLRSQACIRQDTKSVRSVESKSKGKLSRQQCVSKKLGGNGPGDLDIDVKLGAEAISKIRMCNFEDASRREANCSPNEEERRLEGSTNPISEEPNRQENDTSNANELNDKLKLGSKNSGNCKDFVPVGAEYNPSTQENEPMDSDDKENAVGFDENRGDNHSQKQNGKKILGMQYTSGKIKKVSQARENLQQDNVAPVLKFQKPKPTTPKPFRLRTDERRMHKEEANFERKMNFQSHQSASAVSTLSAGNQQIKEVNNIQKESKMIVVQELLQGQERVETASTATPQRSRDPRHQESTPTTSPLQSNAIQRLEKFRKMRSTLQQHSIRPQGFDSTRKEMPYLIPGQKMEVKHVGFPHQEKRGNLRCNLIAGRKEGAPGFEVAILGAAGGIGQPLAMLNVNNPLISVFIIMTWVPYRYQS
ncbi:unnamed protein product [Fraxinus pennsylvanica]|uniref:Uncharacterized protein n=1 Tax=Fraxinus pennsylvanica TaxID=56036 RepID=A0AAD2DTA6_9LAMI|nr:unnamed protein product [Fraxinus pennsylvanica]